MKKNILTLSLLLMLVLIQPVYAGGYNYVSPDKVKNWISSNTPVAILDIQVEEEFNAHHLAGSIATYAYPVKSNADKTKLDEAVSALKTNDNQIVVVCPRGGGGAKRSYDYMKNQGISEKRLLILEKGMAGWPYKEMLKTK